jgi:transcriptional regulator with GAF, ATPase, and Fis domain
MHRPTKKYERKNAMTLTEIGMTQTPVIDEKTFFSETTIRICGSLDIEKALWNCFLYVREVFPVDELILTVYDPSVGALEIVATADRNGGAARSDKTMMPPHLRQQLESAIRYPRVRMLDDVFKDEIVGLVAQQYKWPDSSIIVGRLIIEGKFVGSLIARGAGKGRFSDYHARLWSLVNEPAAIALANSQRFLELLRLKELLADDSKYFQEELRRPFGEEIVGSQFGLRGVMEHVMRVAALPSPVLLIGETGTGKEVIANAIHNLSSRNDGPLIKVNCGAIPESLMDSELFGHEKGAFTGAFAQKRGRFERAHGGTIFLDEVGELPPQAQVRLLRVLQEKEIERVGGSHPISVDIRIVSATHRNLEHLVMNGSFRDDLYYRLGVFPIRIPPLRERKADIPALVEFFIRKKAKEMGLRSIPKLAPGAMDQLIEYHWPGNVREVGNAVERALILSESNSLRFDDILGARNEPKPGSSVHIAEGPLLLNQVEASHILKVLKMTGGRIEGKKGAAALLGMHPGTLRHRMKKLGVPFGRASQSPLWESNP